MAARDKLVEESGIGLQLHVLDGADEGLELTAAADGEQRDRGALDGDVAVINPIDHKIEDYLGNRVQDLVLSMRFHNNEFASGHYIVRNSAWGRAFMREWYELLMPGSVYNGMNKDNDALHWMLLHRLTTDEERSNECVWLGSHHGAYEIHYPKGCRSALWHHVLVLPHTKGFAVDQWLTERRWADRTFMHHGLKKPNDTYARCPPFPQRHDSPLYVSNAVLAQLYINASRASQSRRHQHGYDETACFFHMAAAAHVPGLV